ncbi:Fungal specific transcription factor domain-containing protein [Cladophialophora immunda]|nr:Fungal specific transcription factor domain-containing protein [Cladophialophora immunda]
MAAIPSAPTAESTTVQDRLEKGEVSASSESEQRNTRTSLPMGASSAQLLDTSGSTLVSLAKDPLVDLYYRHFHLFHPLTIPLPHLERLLAAGTTKLNFHPLLAVMRFIGSLYSRSVDSSELKAAAANAILEEAPQTPPSPVTAQCYLLQSISLHWCDELERAQQSMDAAIRIALQLSMNQADFAVNHGEGDPVIEESWRRTWWQIYIIDAHYAAIRHAMTFPTNEVDITTELPCDEEAYESGNIPAPKTLAEFDSREFASDDLVFSSFAYLIGAVRGIASAISRFLTGVAKTGDSLNVLEVVDAAIDGWLLLLPESKKVPVSARGETDEHMFQAHMAIHAASVGLHRPLSELSYDSLEYLSSCSPAPPEISSSLEQSFRGIHTTRCLRSIDCLVRLLAVSTKPAYHTPFTVCMVSSVIIAHLSACKLLLSGPKLDVARDQIRMCIGCLRSFAGVWPLASRTLHEIQTIAREVLGLNQPQQRIESVDPSVADVSSYQEGTIATETLGGFLNYLNFDDLQLSSLSWLPAGG